MMALMMLMMALMMKLMMTFLINANDVDDNVDDVDDNDEGHAGDDVDDIYIMMKCLCVCLSRKNDHFPLPSCEARRSPLGLAGHRPALA